MEQTEQTEEKGCLDIIDDCWEAYKFKVSGKFAMGLSILAGVSSILVAKFVIPAGVVIGITNVGVFFAGVSLEIFANEHKNIRDENISLKNDKEQMVRRYTTGFAFPPDSVAVTPSSTPRNSNKSTKMTEPISIVNQLP